MVTIVKSVEFRVNMTIVTIVTNVTIVTFGTSGQNLTISGFWTAHHSCRKVYL